MGCVPSACWPYPSMHWGGCLPGGCLPRRVVCPGGFLPRVGVYPGVVYPERCLPGGLSISGLGGVSQHALGQTPPRWTDKHLWKPNLRKLHLRAIIKLIIIVFLKNYFLAETNNTSDVGIPVNVSIFFVASPSHDSVYSSALQPFAALKSIQSLKYLQWRV